MNLLLKFRPLLFSPELARRIGLNEAIALQQIEYWVRETESGIEFEGKRWIYNTYPNWVKQFPFWSEETVKRTMISLRKQGLILVEQLNKAKHDRTNYYTVNDDCLALYDQVKSAPSMGPNPPDLSETTTEITQIPFEDIFNVYEKVLPNKPKVKIRDDARKKAIRSLWIKDKKFQSVEFWEKYFKVVRDSRFLSETKTLAFDWLMKPANFKKVAEGNYSNAE